MTPEQLSTVLDSIDKDIETHKKKASEFLSVAHAVLFAAVLFAFLYLAPGIAERALPEAENDLQVARKAYAHRIEAFTKRFHRASYHVTGDRYNELEKSGSLTDEIREAYEISVSEPSGMLVKSLRLVKSLKVEDSKMETLSKLIPIILGAVLAGFLLTYRFHMQAAKEFTLKKIELLAGATKQKDRSSAKATDA